MTRRRSLIAGWGDSTMQGLNNSNVTMSWFDIAALAAGALYVKVARGTERGVTETKQERVADRLTLTEGCTHAVWGHAINDYRSIAVATRELVLNAIICAQRLDARGQRVYTTTCLPSSTSTDSWRTAVNQTSHDQDIIRQEWNRWNRAGAPLATTTLTAATLLSAATFPVASTADFPARGIFVLGGVPIAYTGKTATSLTGCAAPTLAASAHLSYPPIRAATMPSGSRILAPVWWTVAIVGTGQTLPLATITVNDTTDFTSAGTVYIGGQANTYTGKTPTTFTGCANLGRARAVGGGCAMQIASAPGATILAGASGHPLKGYLEIADSVEDARSGIWKYDGATANLYTSDGVHPSSVGHNAIGADVTSFFASVR